MNNCLQEYCVGCGLCQSLDKATLERNEKGYLYPTSGDEEWLKTICPAGGAHFNQLDTKDIWGKSKGVYLGWSKDNNLRQEASSGGVLTELAALLLKKGLVDCIIHTCVDEDNPTKTKVCYSYTREELIHRCGSRYSISHPLIEFNSLDLNKKYAFIGKPCDVTVIKNYMEQAPEIKKSILYTLSFFCAGLPSVNAQDTLLDKMGCTKKCTSLRYRGNGWPGYTTAIDEDGNSYQLDYRSAWGLTLGRDIMKACRLCYDGIGELADISCGDAWYKTNDNKPDFSEHDGRNAIFARTDKGAELINIAAKEGILHIESFENYKEHLGFVQYHQKNRKATIQSKLLAMKLMGKPVPRFNTKYMKIFAKEVRFRGRVRIFLGTIKRILNGKI